MTIGLLLGLGVALTYATSLGGMLPVLKVIVERRNLHEYLREKAAASGAWFAPLLSSAAGLFPPPAVPDAQLRTLLMLLAGLVGVNLAGNTLRACSQYLILYASHRAMMDLRRRMYRKSLHVPAAALAGDVSNRISQFMSDAREVFLGITTLFGKVAREPLKAVCVFALALLLDWRLTLIVVAIAPLAVGLLWYFGRQVRRATVRMLEGYGRLLGSLEETLQGIEVVKSYGREAHERRRIWGIERGMLGQLLKLAWIEAVASPLIEVAGVLIASAGIVWLASQTISGQMEPSHFMTMVVLLTAMLDPVRKVANVYNAVQRAGAAAGRIFDFLDQPEEHAAAPAGVRLLGGRKDGASPAASAAGSAAPANPSVSAGRVTRPREVGFERVTFRYTPEQDPPALRRVTFTVRPGECVAIVGPNGSGKSTLVRLIPRLIEPCEGRVTIDGIDVRNLSLRNLRAEIALVTQRPVIFARTVRENIAYGLPSATLEQVRAAAQQAYAAEFIEQWPAGYDTVVGEFGASMSGGQRQRIAIARAFLKPATILIFDEATSEVDADSERKIHQALRELRRGKTTFLIAHRHTVMDLAERIVVMEGGSIVDVGTREELLDRCPLFVALHRSPTG
jgi:ABC-type multidrug transport system fused ATPase/permease subunit